MKRSDNGVKEKLHTQVYAWPSVFFIQLLLGVTLKGEKKGTKPPGMTIVMVSRVLTLTPAAASGPRSSLYCRLSDLPRPWQIYRIYRRCPNLTGWSCSSPHCYSATLWWVRSLTLNCYLWPQFLPAPGAQRGSVSAEETDWSSQAAENLRLGQIARQLTFPFFKCTTDPSEASFWVGSDRPRHVESQKLFLSLL